MCQACSYKPGGAQCIWIPWLFQTSDLTNLLPSVVMLVADGALPLSCRCIQGPSQPILPATSKHAAALARPTASGSHPTRAAEAVRWVLVLILKPFLGAMQVVGSQSSPRCMAWLRVAYVGLCRVAETDSPQAPRTTSGRLCDRPLSIWGVLWRKRAVRGRLAGELCSRGVGLSILPRGTLPHCETRGNHSRTGPMASLV